MMNVKALSIALFVTSSSYVVMEWVFNPKYFHSNSVESISEDKYRLADEDENCNWVAVAENSCVYFHEKNKVPSEFSINTMASSAIEPAQCEVLTSQIASELPFSAAKHLNDRLITGWVCVVEQAGEEAV
jgi:hypothetical protein